MFKSFFFAVFFMSMAVSVSAQYIPHDDVFYNNGEVYIDSGVVIQIFGHAELDGPRSLFQNNGEVYVHIDTVYTAVDNGFDLNDRALSQGSGLYAVEEHWTNNSPNFIANDSRVHLFGDLQQVIGGAEVTTFNELVLTGTGIGLDRKKRLAVNSIVADSLSLTDRELATDSFIMLVNNPDINALTNDRTTGAEGFVSSLKGDLIIGELQRRTSNSSEAYHYPVGSSLNIPPSLDHVYRPIDIIPKRATANIYGVRLAYEDATSEGYDILQVTDSLCSVNPDYYHMINHPLGFDTATFTFYYDPQLDQVWDQVSQWGNSFWNATAEATLNTPPGQFYTLTLPDWPFYSKDTLPFALADRTPAKPLIIGDQEVCSDDYALLVAESNTQFYSWDVPGHMNPVSGIDSDSLILLMSDSGGFINLYAESSTGKCIEAADSVEMIVFPGPTANFVSDTNQAFTGNTIQFADSSLGFPVEWFWKFGDGNTSDSPLPKHSYDDLGDYIVEMFVKDENGCIDSASMWISVIEGLDIPNVFTPNGDGVNDVFYISNSGVLFYKIQIYNRWGMLIFETSAPEISWDGRTQAGNEVEEGTYYYLLDAETESSTYSQKGFLTLFR